MGFSSIQAYLDPSNWQHQQNHPVIRSTTSNPNNSPPPPPHGAGSIRPGSMSERARLANIPMPDAAQKCPRCDSTNTKFCYFNNYSLSQPRHFCKTCRRYWTRGGVLRNVPVGGGYRRNKRSKSSTNSKPPASGNIMSLSGGSVSTSISGSTGDGSNTTTAANILGLTPQLPPLRFESPLSQQLSYHGFATDVGLNHYSGISASSSPILSTSDQNIGLLGHGGMPSLLSSSGIEPWRLHQYPFLSAGLEPHSAHAGIFNQFQVAGQDHHHGNTAGNGFVCDETGSTGAVFPHIRPKTTLSSSSSMMSPLGHSIKMEDNLNSHAETNLSRQFLGGVSIGNDDAAWIHELPSFSSSSTSKLPL